MDEKKKDERISDFIEVSEIHRKRKNAKRSKLTVGNFNSSGIPKTRK